MTERDTVSLPISASLEPQESSHVNPAVIGSVVVESEPDFSNNTSPPNMKRKFQEVSMGNL